MIPVLALTFNLKALLLLIAAIVFGILALVGFFVPPKDDWKRAVAFAASCLALIAGFIWAAGG